MQVRFSKQVQEMRQTRRTTAATTNNTNSTNDQLKQWDQQVLRSVLVIFLTMMCLDLPHIAIHSLQLNLYNSDAYIILHIIFWLRFCFDPLVYLWCSEQWRAAVWECLRRLPNPFRDGHNTQHTLELTPI